MEKKTEGNVYIIYGDRTWPPCNTITIIARSLFFFFFFFSLLSSFFLPVSVFVLFTNGPSLDGVQHRRVVRETTTRTACKQAAAASSDACDNTVFVNRVTTVAIGRDCKQSRCNTVQLNWSSRFGLRRVRGPRRSHDHVSTPVVGPFQRPFFARSPDCRRRLHSCVSRADFRRLNVDSSRRRRRQAVLRPTQE